MNSEPSTQTQTTEVEITPENNADLQAQIQEIREKQSLFKGLVAGCVAAVVCAVLWAQITVATEYQIGWMAVGVGWLVGYAVRIAGKGIDHSFGLMGATLALLACLLGNVFTNYMFVAKKFVIPVTTVAMKMDLPMLYQLMMNTFDPMDMLFYAIAIYEGYKFAMLSIRVEEE